ncbi:MAG: AGE family epimerase/isomerase [Bacteroidetes bacterium]|nr:AGE family epimerase/isomerase [Bacteroidota bacterium]
MQYRQQLITFHEELEQELNQILSYWITYMPDEVKGGFYGALSDTNEPDPLAPKGQVLCSRIAWTFAAAYQRTHQPNHLQMAERAYRYIRDFFEDHEYGGVYWLVDHTGKMLDGKKQVYGLAFCIYAMAEYYKATGDPEALRFSIELYNTIERYSFDPVAGGYIEAFARDWQPAADLRLSEKDRNDKKTMNTHLHVVEAYANLYTVWPDPELQKKISGLLDYFGNYMIDKATNHLLLFMDEQWKPMSFIRSYGHDIEASWLLLESAEIAGDDKHIQRFRHYAISLAVASSAGLDERDGGMWHETDPIQPDRPKEKHWWPQAEAMVGFFNAFEISGDSQWLFRSLASWDYIKNQIRDELYGEWYWGRDDNGEIIREVKAGFWKCPYHNARACMELMRRISHVLQQMPAIG